jgi:hypothetical protein
MAASETDTAMQIRLHQTAGMLLRAIEDALTRIRYEKFGICAEFWQPISKARLEALPGPGGAETARNGRILEAEMQPFAAIRDDILVSVHVGHEGDLAGIERTNGMLL